MTNPKTCSIEDLPRVTIFILLALCWLIIASGCTVRHVQLQDKDDVIFYYWRGELLMQSETEFKLGDLEFEQNRDPENVKVITPYGTAESGE